MELYQHLPLLKTFMTVVQEGSFTRAATKLKVSKVAVSKQIRKLEDSIEQQLLSRNNRRIQLTDLGEQFYQQCLQIDREVEAATAVLSHYQQERHRRINGSDHR